MLVRIVCPGHRALRVARWFPLDPAGRRGAVPSMCHPLPLASEMGPRDARPLVDGVSTSARFDHYRRRERDMSLLASGLPRLSHEGMHRAGFVALRFRRRRRRR